jgi:hypothetical protein
VTVTLDGVATLDDLAAAGAEIDWLWEGWIQRNVLTILASEPGGGKTRLTCDLIRRIRHGLPWPDGQAMTLPPDSKVMYVPPRQQSRRTGHHRPKF